MIERLRRLVAALRRAGLPPADHQEQVQNLVDWEWHAARLEEHLARVEADGGDVEAWIQVHLQLEDLQGILRELDQAVRAVIARPDDG